MDKIEKIPIAPDEPVFPISVVAQELKIHQRTLRIYDEEKILYPERSTKNRGLYSFNDIRKGKFIIYLTKKLGLNLAGVRITLELLHKLETPLDNYRNTIEEIALKYDLIPEKI